MDLNKINNKEFPLLRKNVITSDKNSFGLEQTRCYQNINGNSFIYLEYSSFLKQFNVKVSNQNLEIELFEKKKILKATFLLKKMIFYLY